SSTKNDERFLHFFWEIDTGEARWANFTKGGGYSKWIGLEWHVVDWHPTGERIKQYVLQRYPYLNGNYGWLIKYEDWHFKAGLTYSRMARGSMGARIMDNSIFGHQAHGIFPIYPETRETLISF